MRNFLQWLFSDGQPRYWEIPYMDRDEDLFIDGSSSGPCMTHDDRNHAKCLTHECCIGNNAGECRSE